MRTTLIACTLALLVPAAALAASAPGPSHNVPPPKCMAAIGIPKLDAGSKDAAKMSVKISPEFTRGKKGSGKAASANIGSQSSGAGAGKISSHNIGSQSSGAGAGKVSSCGAGEHSDESPKETVH